MKVFIGNDNNAVEMKNLVRKQLQEMGHEVVDLGVHATDDGKYYPNVAQELCEAIIAENYQARGILICGTGIGMAITANKFPGIYAAVGHDIYSTERSILSNNCNVLCMGALVIGPQAALAYAKRWMELEFVDSPSSAKIDVMRNIDKANRKA